jgi:hypothetical protein
VAQEEALASLETIEEQFVRACELSPEDRQARERSAEDGRRGRLATEEHVREFSIAIAYMPQSRVGLERSSIMTKLLEQAIAQVRELPEEDQDGAADALFAYIARSDRPYPVTYEQLEEVKRRQKALQDGETRLATDEEVAAVWKRCGQ